MDNILSYPWKKALRMANQWLPKEQPLNDYHWMVIYLQKVRMAHTVKGRMTNFFFLWRIVEVTFSNQCDNISYIVINWPLIPRNLACHFPLLGMNINFCYSGGKQSGGVNKEGINFYNSLINELLSKGHYFLSSLYILKKIT